MHSARMCRALFIGLKSADRLRYLTEAATNTARALWALRNKNHV